jgi:hypothetical protein
MIFFLIYQAKIMISQDRLSLNSQTQQMSKEELINDFRQLFFPTNEKVIQIRKDIYDSLHDIRYPKMTLKETSSDFRQLTNQEFIRLLVNSVHPVCRRPLFNEDTVALFIQGSLYDHFFLESFCWEPKVHSINWELRKQLEWKVETNKNIYELGEPIYLRFLIKHISDGSMRIIENDLINPYFILHSINLTKVEEKEKIKVFLTQQGYINYMPAKVLIDKNKLFNHLCILKPAEDIQIQFMRQSLNLFYDLTLSGEYELTFYTRNYIGDNQVGEFPKPCTIHFKIDGLNNGQDKQIVWPENNYDL